MIGRGRRGAARRGVARILDRVHLATFGHRMSPDMARFLRNLSWSFLGGILAAALLFVVHVLVGRALGPEEYGKVTLVLVLSQLFGLLGAGGLDVASARLVPRASTDDQRAELVTTATVIVIGALLATALVLTATRGLIADVAGADETLVLVAVAATVVFGARTLFDRQTGALERFRAQSGIRVAEGVVALALVTVLLLAGGSSYLGVTVVLLAAGAVAVAVPAWVLRGLLRARALRGERARELWRYARIALLHAVAPMGVVYGDRLVVNAELGAEDLGVFGAYYTASYAVMTQLLSGVSTVLFPASARLDDKAAVVAKLRRLRALGTVPAALVLIAVIYVVLLLFGARYPFELVTAALFASWGAVVLFNGLFTVITVTHSARTFLLTAAFQAVRSVLFLAYLGAIVVLDSVSVEAILVGMVLIELLEAANLRRIVSRQVLADPAPARA